MCVTDKRGELLEWLAKTVGCAYLSDLKQPEYREKLIKAIREAPEDAWPVKSWRDASGYICGEARAAKNEHEVRDQLDHWLRIE